MIVFLSNPLMMHTLFVIMVIIIWLCINDENQKIIVIIEFIHRVANWLNVVEKVHVLYYTICFITGGQPEMLQHKLA